MLKIFTRDTKTNDPFCGITLGDEVKDVLSGFTGIVISRCEYLTGCNQLFILPKSEKANEIKDGHWFDIERIEKIANRKVDVVPRRTGSDIEPPKVTGGKYD